MDDTTSFVRVKQYFKTVERLDPVTHERVRYRVNLDYDIGIVDDAAEGYYTVGSPFQLFSVAMHGTPLTNSRVLVESVEMPLDQLTGAAREPVGADLVFKFPNI